MSRPLKRPRTGICGASDPEVEQVQNLEEFRVPDMPYAEVFYVAHFIGEDTTNEWYNELLKLDSCTFPFCDRRVLNSNEFQGTNLSLRCTARRLFSRGRLPVRRLYPYMQGGLHVHRSGQLMRQIPSSHSSTADRRSTCDTSILLSYEKSKTTSRKGSA